MGGGETSALCAGLGEFQPRSLGTESCEDGLQHRVHLQPSNLRSDEDYSSTQGPGSKRGPREGDRRSTHQRGYQDCSSRRRSGTFPIILFPDTEEVGSLETNSQPTTLEFSVHPSEEVQNGDLNFHYTDLDSRHVGSFVGPSGCLPTYSNCSRGSTLPSLQLQGHRLPVQGPSFRAFDGTKGFHQSYSNRLSFPAKERHRRICLSGRLAYCGKIRRADPKKCRYYSFPPRGLRVDYQQGEVVSGSNSASSLLGSSTRFCDGNGLSFQGTSRRVDPSNQFFVDRETGPSQEMVAIVGNHGKPRRYLESLQTTNEASTTTSASVLQSFQRT